ncbi:AraC family transcriptional regulator [Agromyces larvae]|uniref:Helix-turn-helix transcriptional regulator n=1 Tax=Agromyces larvae TaxID=2929802 RepID=A0ABY4C2G2_9MICO|nr:helix-turn-helix transcriptional regulator [Agromyces larvae]UOE45666.1 helix-turn-helix transcriptional regulator [Agromyces larvae]
MPLRRQSSDSAAVTSYVWATGGRHLWASGGSSSRQSHDRGHLVYAASGVLTVHVDRGTSVVPSNRIAWTPAGTPHRHRAHGDTDMRILFLPPSLARRIPDRPAVFLATDLAREVFRALTGPRDDVATPAYGPAARIRLLRVLVDELSEAHEQPLHLPEPLDDRLRAIANALSERPDDDASAAELGRMAGASARTVSRLVRTELGMTFYEWRTQLRIAHALVLLAEGHDVTATAHACGWSNPSSFIAAFTNVIGTTPGRYQAGGRRPVARVDEAATGSRRRPRTRA